MDGSIEVMVMVDVFVVVTMMSATYGSGNGLVV